MFTEQFYLTILLVLLLVIISIIYIVRLMFRFNGYSHPYPPVAPPRTSGGGGGGGGVAILGIVVALVIILAVNFDQRAAPNQGQQNHVSQPHRFQEPSEPRSMAPPEHRQPLEQESPRTMMVNEHHTISTHSGDPYEAERLNQAPSHDHLSQFYGIQMGAFGHKPYANSLINKLLPKHPSVQLRFKNGDQPFKVVIGQFKTKKSAQDYKRFYGLTDGLVLFYQY